jgi:cytochrome c-type biogenesis protein
MTGGPGFQVAIGRLLGRIFRRIETWTAPVPEPVLGAALLALAALFVLATLRDRRSPRNAADPDPGAGAGARAAGARPCHPSDHPTREESRS